MNLKSHTATGKPTIPTDAHVRLATGDGNEKILRRGYSYMDGIKSKIGEIDAGLFFICFQRDPQHQFVPIQRRLALQDSLNEYITHTSSGVFACPPGARDSRFIGSGLLD